MYLAAICFCGFDLLKEGVSVGRGVRSLQPFLRCGLCSMHPFLFLSISLDVNADNKNSFASNVVKKGANSKTTFSEEKILGRKKTFSEKIFLLESIKARPRWPREKPENRFVRLWRFFVAAQFNIAFAGDVTDLPDDVTGDGIDVPLDSFSSLVMCSFEHSNIHSPNIPRQHMSGV